MSNNLLRYQPNAILYGRCSYLKPERTKIEAF
jgi:hypothetical protein